MIDTPVIIISEAWANAAALAILAVYVINAILKIWLNFERRKYRKAVDRAEAMFARNEEILNEQP